MIYRRRPTLPLRYSRTMSCERELIRIVDRAVAEAASKAGGWLACRPGCFECCLGPFPISELDALRLRRGLEELERSQPGRAARVAESARQIAARGGMADDEPCPALDPQTGTCDLYQARPLTCRTFGPPVRGADGALAICELCFQGASENEIAACAVDLDIDALEVEGEETMVAFALAPAFAPGIGRACEDRDPGQRRGRGPGAES